MVKKVIRYFIFNLIAIYLVERYLGGVDYAGNYQVLALSALALTVTMLVIRPIVKLITLPLNILTLGMFGSFLNAILLYGVTFAVPQFGIHPFDFPGLVYKGLVVPPLHFGAISAVVVVAFALSTITSVLAWLTD